MYAVVSFAYVDGACGRAHVSAASNTHFLHSSRRKQLETIHTGVSENRGTLLGVPIKLNKDYTVLGYIQGTPFWGNAHISGKLGYVGP